MIQHCKTVDSVKIRGCLPTNRFKISPSTVFTMDFTIIYHVFTYKFTNSPHISPYWDFAKMYPHIINFNKIFHEINHPAIGISPYTHHITIYHIFPYISHLNTTHFQCTRNQHSPHISPSLTLCSPYIHYVVGGFNPSDKYELGWWHSIPNIIGKSIQIPWFQSTNQ